jgi:hypothetical protein
MRCPITTCRSALYSSWEDDNGIAHGRCYTCGGEQGPPTWKGKDVSEAALPSKGRWVRIKEPKANGVTRIHEGPVWQVKPGNDCRVVDYVSVGHDSFRVSFSIGVDEEGHGPTTWEYIAPSEPAKDGSFWVIPAVAPDNYDVIWQRREDLGLPDRKTHWVRAGRSRPLCWDEIPGRERGYLLEVRRD